MSKIGRSGAPSPSMDFSLRSKIFCRSTGPGSAYLDVSLATSTDGRSNGLASSRVDLRTGEVMQSAEPSSAELPQSVFDHLPLKRIISEQDDVLFEDEDHYHTIAITSEDTTRWQVTSTPKIVANDVQCFYVPIGRDAGVLALSPEEVKFSSNTKQYRSQPFTRCPSALSSLLQSGTQLDHVVVRATDKVATLFILHLQNAGEPQIWRIQALAYRSGLAIQQLTHAVDEADVLHQRAMLQEEDIHLIKKTGTTGESGDSLALTYAGKGRVVRFHLSIEDGTFKFRHDLSTRIVSDNLTSVITDDSRKIATGEHKD